MIAIGDILLPDAIKDEHFVCDLSKCKGACCVEGDQGAPLEEDEVQKLLEIREVLRPLLRDEGNAALDVQGAFIRKKDNAYTPLVNEKECAYVLFENGFAQCGIEKAWQEGLVDFQKPISCHLYPIRVKKYPEFEAVNYEVWDICSPACALGDKLKVPIYKFVKDALIRKYGAEFYEMLEATIEHVDQSAATDEE